MKQINDKIKMNALPRFDRKYLRMYQGGIFRNWYNLRKLAIFYHTEKRIEQGNTTFDLNFYFSNLELLLIFLSLLLVHLMEVIIY